MASRNTDVRSLSGNQARLVLSLLEANESTVDPDVAVTKLGISRGYAKKLLHELTVKGWLHRQAPARYRVVPPEWGPYRLPDLDIHAAALAHAPDGYVGLASAAALQGLTTQHRRAVWVILARRKREVQVGEVPVHFVHAKAGLLFGTETRQVLGNGIAVSDPEKTALDCLYYGPGTFDFGELTGIVARAARRENWERLGEYVKRFANGPLARRLGLLLQLAKIESPTSFVKVLQAFPVPHNPVRLDPSRASSPADSVDRTWGVRINVSAESLFRV